MNEEDDLYGGGMEGNGRFDTEEFDQEYIDGGIRDDVREILMLWIVVRLYVK